MSERWSKPSLMYCSVSSTTMPEPLSALFMIRVGSDWSSLRAFFCVGVRFGVILRGFIVLISVLTLFRYFSMSLEAFGGIQVLFSLKGCGSVDGRSLKKCLILFPLSKSSRDSMSWDWSKCLLGTKVKPNDRTSVWGGSRVLEERLVMYFSLLICIWISPFVCLWMAFLDFLLMNLGCFGVEHLCKVFTL